jgi:hypothetical protein
MTERTAKPGRMDAAAQAAGSASRFGGDPLDYLPIHAWLDAYVTDREPGFRALRHHAEGVFAVEEVFGIALTLSSDVRVPVRYVAERHVLHELGRIPSAADWLRALDVQPWMRGRRLPGQE